MLQSLHLQNLGPAPEISLAFGERVNLITGDNGLGKTFLLDLAWWALTRNWADSRIIRPGRAEPFAQIAYTVIGKGGAPSTAKLEYSLEQGQWLPFPPGPPPAPGLVIYPRIDGGFSVKDPERNRWRDRDDSGRPIPRPEAFHFSKRQVWEGLKDEEGRVVCRGLIEDWNTWQLKGNGAFHLLSQVLEGLSPGGPESPLRPGPPTRLPEDYGNVDIPTLILPYGEIPIYHASAAIRRILSLAYLLVWAWTEHRLEADARKHEPARRIILLWDEIEAHLHPQWQRTILPAVLGVLEGLMKELDGPSPQIIATTHAPLVLASMETRWKDDIDRLFNLELNEGEKKVRVEEVTWARFGDASSWLTSPAFDLETGYSREAERAIHAADCLMADEPDMLHLGLESKEAIHNELKRTLAPEDLFWTLWLPYYEQDDEGPENNNLYINA